MSNTLVRVPYDTRFYGTPRAVARLMRACQIAGHNIPLTDGWRSLEEQLYYWNRYINKQPGWTIASNPYTGQRNHMRGEAWDIEHIADRAAMLAAGFTADDVEWWHFNDPDWASMPIIPDASGLALLTAIPITVPTKEEDMKYFIGGEVPETGKPNSGTLVFGGPGVVPFPIPGPIWQDVLSRYADAMNADKPLAFKKAEWKLIRQALGNTQSTPALQLSITKAGY